MPSAANHHKYGPPNKVVLQRKYSVGWSLFLPTRLDCDITDSHKVSRHVATEGFRMNAAVLHTLGKPPRCQVFREPVSAGDEVILHVLGAALKPVDKQMASGSHYAQPARASADLRN